MLKEFLKKAGDYYTVVRERCFDDLFQNLTEEVEATIPRTKKNKKGTGSPPKDASAFKRDDVQSYLGKLSSTHHM